MLRIFLVILSVTTVVAAPAPKDARRPTAAALSQSIGKSHLGKEVRAIGQAMGEDPTIHYPHWHEDLAKNQEAHFFQLKWKKKGLALYFDKGNLHTAWLYNDKVEGYGRYSGELPEGLAFENSLTDVEMKLGKPDVTFQDPLKGEVKAGMEVKVDAIYKQKGLCVRFAKTAEGNTIITAIALFPAGDAPSW